VASEKHVLGEKNIRTSRQKSRALLDEICIDDISAALRVLATLYHLDRIGEPHTLNFEILKSLEKTQK
jgi:hypothetical protein